MNPEQVSDRHRRRLALVYVRQSSPHQVIHHQESQRRQRQFVHRAEQLGWVADQIQVVDDDLGQSGSRSGQRFGFEEMVSRTALGQIGLILALEVARLARSNRDWYHLLDVCALTATLIADEEGLYDPASYNDRLLLGLKGTMSEAELYLIRQRLVEATRAKARRGELQRKLAPGYVWDEAGRMQKDPDAQVVGAIARVFARFEQVGTIHQTHLHLLHDGVEVPVRTPEGKLLWRPPTYEQVRRLLSNPVYAGVYVYGRRQTEERLDAAFKPTKRLRPVELEQCHAFLKDHHEGYISWEQYELNQQRIEENYRGPEEPGAPREGSCLLQGLVLCGRCGRHMSVHYGKPEGQVRFTCAKARQQRGESVCQSFGAVRLAKAVEGLILEALSPLGMEAMVCAAASYRDEHQAQRRQWEQRVERARYEVGLARRAYEAVDPEHRLVAGELERRWEKALSDLGKIEAEAAARLGQLEAPLGEEEARELKAYAAQVGSLWRAPSTRVQERKRIARCLLEKVVVLCAPQAERLQAEVYWKGGERSRIELPRGKTGEHRCVSDPELVDLVRTLASEFADEQIARILHRKGIKTPKGHAFRAYHVANLRHGYSIAKGPSLAVDGEDVYTAQEAGRLLGVTHDTVIRWVEAGLLRGRQITAGAPWRVQVRPEDLARLKPVEADPTWVPLKGAALALGVSQQTVLQKLKAGQLEAVRVQTGRRSAWRIHLPPGLDESQPRLL
ncbi:MAG: recombinase family protein [Verrucomicrobia bacterium]|nr:recombinase family protein [Verrucomicrobiota bacterium]